MVEDDTHTPDIDQLYSDLVRIVRKAGDIALSYYGQHIKSWDKSHNNPVSDADLAVNRYLQQELQALDSEIGWLSEENEDIIDLKNNGKYLIAMDPLDGSSNIEANVSIGTIFSIIPTNGLKPEDAIFQTDDENDPWYKHNLYFSTDGNWPNIADEQPPMENYVDFAKENYKENKTKLFKAIPAKLID